MKKMGFILLLFPFFQGFSQPITFEIIYGGSGYDEARSIWQTTDGGYIVAGTSGSYPSGNSDVFLLRLDSLGAIQWFKFPGGNNLQAGYSVQQTSDGGFIVAGLTDAGGFGGYDVYLMKTDMNGDTLWTKTYGGSDWDFGYHVEETNDNGFIIGGTTYSFGKAEQMYLIKTDANGDTAWTKTYGGTGQERANCVRQTNDGGYVLVGYTTSYGAGGKDLYILKTDVNGDSLWSKTYGSNNDETGTFADNTSDNGIVFCGYAENYQNGKVYAALIKLSNSGSESFATYIAGPDADEYPLVVRETQDGGFAYAGYVAGLGAGALDYRLVKFDSGGGVQWGKTYGGSKDEVSNSMQTTSEGGFILAGSTMSYGNGTKDIYIFKSDDQGFSTGNVVIGVEENQQTNILINVYPNPATEKITVFADISNNELKNQIIVSLCDLTGRQILQKKIEKNEFNKNFEFIVNDILSGLYILHFSSGDFHFQRKVLIKH